MIKFVEIFTMQVLYLQSMIQGNLLSKPNKNMILSFFERKTRTACPYLVFNAKGRNRKKSTKTSK